MSGPWEDYGGAPAATAAPPPMADGPWADYAPAAPAPLPPPRPTGADLPDWDSPNNPARHGGRFVTGLVEGISSGLTAPGDAFEGKYDPMADYREKGFLSRATDIAGLYVPSAVGGGPRLAPRAAPEAVAPSSAGGAPQAAPAAAVRQAAENIGVDLPRVVSTDSMGLQRLGATLKTIPLAGDPLVQRSQNAIRQVGDAVDRVAGEFGGSTGYNSGHRVGQVLGDLAEAEATAARQAAQAADDAAMRQWEQTRSGAIAAADAAEQAALQRAQAATGNVAPGDMGAAVTQRVRSAEQAAKAEKERLYGVAGETDASIQANSVREVRARVAQALEDEGRVIDQVITPATSRMLDQLAKLSNLEIPNKAVGARVAAAPGEALEIAGVSLKGIEQTRKVIGNLAQAAGNDADRAAARIVMRQFDNWLDDAFDSALYSGSEDALTAIRAARAANKDWRQRFGFNPEADADKLLNRMAVGEVTPQEAANWVIGNSKVGAAGSSARLIDRIRTATKNDPGTLDAMRGAVWNRLTQTAEGVSGRDPMKVANEIGEFLNGAGRDVANRLFDQNQRAVMKAYAETVRVANAGRQAAEDLAKATKPKPTQVDIGPMQELAKTVLGRQGDRADEAIFKAIQSYAQAGGGGNAAVLSRLLQALPQDVKGDLAGSMIRNMGISERSQGFSADLWLSNWNKTTPQAKALLFGNAGATRAALDDIATVAGRMKDLQKFGNPSGTAQNAAGLAGLGWFTADPLAAIGAALGGRVVAEMLSRPASAASAAKWSRAYEKLANSPTPGALAALERATRNLSATVGVPISLEAIRQVTDRSRQYQ